MPVTDISDIIYNFDRSYADLPAVNLPLRILNPNYAESSTLLQVTSAYTNEQDKLIFYPFFGDTTIFTDYIGLSVTPIVDDYRYFIDFGDGTITSDLTAEHYYKYPGEYQVTLVAVDSATNFYKSEQQPTIKAYNAIPDKIFLAYKEGNSALNSTFENPIVITRYNSYQSWPSVSADGGYTINLSVSGNRSNFIKPVDYYSDSYVQLKKFAAFVQSDETGDTVIVDSIKTNNDKIYGKRFVTAVSDYVFFSEPVDGSIFLGTSGTSEFYYYED
jgi:hypothetical protein